MDDTARINLRTLALLIDATTEDQVNFRNSIESMTNLRQKHIEKNKKRPQYEFEKT